MTTTSGGSGLTEHWDRFSRARALHDPPLRPSAEDLAYFWEMVDEWVRERGTPRVLLLGVTPELHDLPWPEGTDLLTVDRSQVAIDALRLGAKDAVCCAEWLSMDLPEGSRDIALCDGGLHLLDYPQGQRELVRRLRRTLSDGGLCIFRLFLRPSRPETPDAVLRDLLEGKVGNLSALKLRLFTSMQSSPEEGVEFGKVYKAFIQAVPDPEQMAVKIGWPVERMMVIENYKGLNDKVHMLTEEQTIGLFCDVPGGFRVHRVRTPSYELGTRCPTVAFERIADR